MAVIDIAHLHKRYGSKVAVRDVSLSVERGEIFGILGPNGAGKTTTVECIEGLRRPDSGSISILGLDPRTDTTQLRQQLGVQLQEAELPDRLKVGEALELYAAFYDAPADADELLATLGLSEQRDTAFKKLSGGQQQRLSIALALIGAPEVAVLDELTTGLDPASRRDTWQLIERVRARGITIVLVTHFMEEAQRLCDRVAVLDAGEVVAVDTPAGLIGRTLEEQRIEFVPSEPLRDELLTGLVEVRGIERHGQRVVVIGTGNLLHAVSSVLAREQIIAGQLRVHEASLDDAFVALTGKQLG